MCNPPNMPFYSLWCIQGNLRDRESHNSELMPTCQSKISIINFCLASGKDRNNSNREFFNAQTVLCSWCISPGCQSRFGAGGKIVERRVKKMKLAGRHLVEYTKSQQSCFMWGKLNVVESRRARVRTHTYMPGRIPTLCSLCPCHFGVAQCLQRAHKSFGTACSVVNGWNRAWCEEANISCGLCLSNAPSQNY